MDLQILNKLIIDHLRHYGYSIAARLIENEFKKVIVKSQTKPSELLTLAMKSYLNDALNEVKENLRMELKEHETLLKMEKALTEKKVGDLEYPLVSNKWSEISSHSANTLQKPKDKLEELIDESKYTISKSPLNFKKQNKLIMRNGKDRDEQEQEQENDRVNTNPDGEYTLTSEITLIDDVNRNLQKQGMNYSKTNLYNNHISDKRLGYKFADNSSKKNLDFVKEEAINGNLPISNSNRQFNMKNIKSKNFKRIRLDSIKHYLDNDQSKNTSNTIILDGSNIKMPGIHIPSIDNDISLRSNHKRSRSKVTLERNIVMIENYEPIIKDKNKARATYTNRLLKKDSIKGKKIENYKNKNKNNEFDLLKINTPVKSGLQNENYNTEPRNYTYRKEERIDPYSRLNATMTYAESGSEDKNNPLFTPYEYPSKNKDHDPVRFQEEYTIPFELTALDINKNNGANSKLAFENQAMRTAYFTMNKDINHKDLDLHANKIPHHQLSILQDKTPSPVPDIDSPLSHHHFFSQDTNNLWNVEDTQQKAASKKIPIDDVNPTDNLPTSKNSQNQLDKHKPQKQPFHENTFIKTNSDISPGNTNIGNKAASPNDMPVKAINDINDLNKLIGSIYKNLKPNRKISNPDLIFDNVTGQFFINPSTLKNLLISTKFDENQLQNYLNSYVKASDYKENSEMLLDLEKFKEFFRETIKIKSANFAELCYNYLVNDETIHESQNVVSFKEVVMLLDTFNPESPFMLMKSLFRMLGNSQNNPKISLSKVKETLNEIENGEPRKEGEEGLDHIVRILKNSIDYLSNSYGEIEMTFEKYMEVIEDYQPLKKYA